MNLEKEIKKALIKHFTERHERGVNVDSEYIQTFTKHFLERVALRRGCNQ